MRAHTHTHTHEHKHTSRATILRSDPKVHTLAPHPCRPLTTAVHPDKKQGLQSGCTTTHRPQPHPEVSSQRPARVTDCPVSGGNVMEAAGLGPVIRGPTAGWPDYHIDDDGLLETRPCWFQGRLRPMVTAQTLILGKLLVLIQTLWWRKSFHKSVETYLVWCRYVDRWKHVLVLIQTRWWRKSFHKGEETYLVR